MKKRQLSCRLQGQISQPLLLTPPFNHSFPCCHIAATLSSCLFRLTADEFLFSGFITVCQFILCNLVWKAAEINSDSWKSKYEFFMVLKVKESASSGEAFLPILVDILGATLHLFEPDHHFFFYSLILKFDIHCSVHCAHPQWLLVLLIWVFTVMALSLFLNPVTLSSLRVPGTQFSFPIWIFHLPHAITIFSLLT